MVLHVEALLLFLAITNKNCVLADDYDGSGVRHGNAYWDDNFVKEVAERVAKSAVRDYLRESSKAGTSQLRNRESDPFDPCYSNKDPGHCNGSSARWYYDHDCEACKVFTYSGCGGNDNNFQTGQECMKQCGVMSLEAAGFGNRYDPATRGKVGKSGGKDKGGKKTGGKGKSSKAG